MNSSLLWVAAAGESCLVALVLFGLVRVWRMRARAVEGDEGPRGWDALRAVLRESLPDGATEAVLSEARVFVAALKSFARRPLEQVDVKPGWRRFRALEASSYGNVVVMLLLLIVLEAPVVHFILGALMDDSALRAFIRGLTLGSSIYLAMWLIGDLRLLRETAGILLGKDGLVVELGLRVNGTVALEKVLRAEHLVAADAKRVHGSRAIRISPQPRPNCRVTLSSTVAMRGIFGIPLKGELLDIFVDDPSELVSSIETAIAAAKA